MVRGLIALLLMVSCLGASVHVIQSDYELYLKESKCVQKHIKAGVPRKNIKTGNGTCKVT